MYNERIKPLFQSSGKSDAYLEKEINLPRGIIYDWNIGRSKSYKKYIGEIAEYFNVTTDYLLGKTDNPTAENNSDIDDSQDPIFFRLKKGLEDYNIDNDDIDFLLTVMKAHKERNK